MKRRIFSAILALILVAALSSAAAFADDGTSDKSWYSDGQSTFVLYDAADLLGFKALVNSGTNFSGKTVSLGANIDISGIEWDPIGVSDGENDRAFQGAFDGNGRTISGLTMKELASKPYYNSMDTGDYYAYGFFGGIRHATVRNVTFADVDIDFSGSEAETATNNNTVAAAVGAALNGSVIENVTVSGSVTGHSRTAGIVGYIGGSKTGTDTLLTGDDMTDMDNIVIRGCVNHADVKSAMTASNYGTAGGICATLNIKSSTSGSFLFEGNANYGDVSGFFSAGILASSFNNTTSAPVNVTFSGNTNSGSISSNTASSGTASVGITMGTVGNVSGGKGVLSGNVNLGSVSSTGGVAVGIIKEAYSNTSFAGTNENRGEITGCTEAAGIIASCHGLTLENLTNTGDITVTGDVVRPVGDKHGIGSISSPKAGGIVSTFATHGTGANSDSTLDGASCVNSGTVSHETSGEKSPLVGSLAGSVTRGIIKNLTDDEAIGVVNMAGGGAFSTTFENVQLNELEVFAAHNQSYTYELILNNSSIGSINVSGPCHTGITLAVKGGTVGSIEFDGVTQNKKADGSDADSYVSGINLSFAATDGAKIGEVIVTSEENSIYNLSIAAAGDSVIETVTTSEPVIIGFSHSDGKGYIYEAPNSGTIDTIKTSDDSVTVNSAVASVIQPTAHIVYVTNTISGLGSEILGGKATDSGKNLFNGVELTASSAEAITVAANKTLYVPEGVELSGSIINNGNIVNNGTVSNVSGSGTLNHIVTFVSEGVELSTAEIGSGTTVAEPAEPVRGGYSFLGWYNGETEYDFSAAVTAPLTLTAKWEEITYPVPDPNPITITQPANGTVSTNFSNASVGATITVTATPNSGYVLSYITVNGEKIDGNTFVMPDKAVTVSAVFVPATGGFADVVPGAWYVDAVNYVVANGLMEGTSATTFEPDAQMTRAMFWTILARIDGETITGSTWADAARTWAMANGVSDGTNPHAPLPREQLVTMLWRYLGEPSTTGTLANFTDANAVSDWAKTAMAWAIEKGIITGVTTTTLAPQSAATRAQCATILMRNAL